MVDQSNYDDPIYKKFKNVLKGAKEGEVVTRFPPEPSGFLHIGHCKAAMLNFHYAKMYKGKMILRFDDTNPLNEKMEFQENIIRDLKTLEIVPDRLTFSSDYFEQLQDYMTTMIKNGLCYADNTPGDQMKIERDEGIESKHRAKTVDENMKIFKDMCNGKITDYCIRAKLNMQDKVKCLRDPVLYRCKPDAVHHRTGTKFKAYPTYDFTCPIVDSIEGVTHALRTVEYRDRNALYDWVQKSLGLRKVIIYDFAKLNLTSTLLSKRKLKWFVDEGHVEGWNDPRFPTVQGIMRRGMTVNALKEFMLEQGPSRNTNLMEWDKIWAINKNVLDPVVPRYTAISKDTASKLIVENGPEPLEARSAPLHQKNEAAGTKSVIYARELYIEKDDASEIKEGDKVTLMKWGNVTIHKKESQDNGNFTLYGKIDEADKDFKKTRKITWIAAVPEHTVELVLVELDHLINKAKVEDKDDVKDLVNKNSRIEYLAYAEASVKGLQKGAMFQFERRGFYLVDSVAFGGKKMTCIFIPDGKTKAMSAVSHAIDAKEQAKGKGGVDGGNKKQKEQKVDADGNVVLSKAEAKKQAKKAAKKDGKKSDGPVDIAKLKAEAAERKKQKEQAAAQASPAPQASAAVAVKQYQPNPMNAKFNQLEAQLIENEGAFLNGHQPSKADHDAISELGRSVGPCPMLYPNLFAWYCFVSKVNPKLSANWPEIKVEKPVAAEEDDLDLFGEDDGEAAAAAAEAKANAEKKKKKVKAPVIAKSLILYEVKPWEEDTDLDELAKKILAIEMDGLLWKTQYKKEPIAFGINKLLIGATVEDEKVSTDDLQEKIEAFEDYVQSVDIAAFNKV